MENELVNYLEFYVLVSAAKVKLIEYRIGYTWISRYCPMLPALRIRIYVLSKILPFELNILFGNLSCKRQIENEPTPKRLIFKKYYVLSESQNDMPFVFSLNNSLINSSIA